MTGPQVKELAATNDEFCEATAFLWTQQDSLAAELTDLRTMAQHLLRVVMIDSAPVPKIVVPGQAPAVDKQVQMNDSVNAAIAVAIKWGQAVGFITIQGETNAAGTDVPADQPCDDPNNSGGLRLVGSEDNDGSGCPPSPS